MTINYKFENILGYIDKNKLRETFITTSFTELVNKVIEICNLNRNKINIFRFFFEYSDTKDYIGAIDCNIKINHKTKSKKFIFNKINSAMQDSMYQELCMLINYNIIDKIKLKQKNNHKIPRPIWRK